LAILLIGAGTVEKSEFLFSIRLIISVTEFCMDVTVAGVDPDLVPPHASFSISSVEPYFVIIIVIALQ
jgi:hypothetical protein